VPPGRIGLCFAAASPRLAPGACHCFFRRKSRPGVLHTRFTHAQKRIVAFISRDVSISNGITSVGSVWLAADVLRVYGDKTVC